MSNQNVQLGFDLAFARDASFFARLKIKLASLKSDTISHPIRWRENIFRRNDGLKLKGSNFFCIKGGQIEERWSFDFRDSHTSERYLSVTLSGEAYCLALSKNKLSF